jgi:thiol:disulfide interchange protein
MDATTLRAPEVRQRLDQMVRLKIQADDFGDPALTPLLSHFNIPGLPAYVVLVP